MDLPVYRRGLGAFSYTQLRGRGIVDWDCSGVGSPCLTGSPIGARHRQQRSAKKANTKDESDQE